jgi:hypothetical protein
MKLVAGDVAGEATTEEIRGSVDKAKGHSPGRLSSVEPVLPGNGRVVDPEIATTPRSSSDIKRTPVSTRSIGREGGVDHVHGLRRRTSDAK